METHRIEAEAAAVAALERRALTGADRTFTNHAGEEFVILTTLTSDGITETLLRVPTPGGVDIAQPVRIKQSLSIQDQASMADYVKRFRERGSLLLADIDKSAIVGVLNYHRAEDGDLEAGFGDHVATLQLPFSFEWQQWSKIDGTLLSQLALVQFIEENREDVVSPDAATLLEAVRDLQALRKADFRSVVREDSDNVRIEFTEDADVRPSAVTMPSEFLLRLPVYFGGPEVEIQALLRWRLDDGKLLLGVRLKRMERIRQAEFRRIVTELSEDTGVQAIYGARA